MNLQECLELGYTCGLETVGEAIDNVELHAFNLFKHSLVSKELEELFQESRNIDSSIKISNILTEEQINNIDKGLEEIAF